MTRRAAPKGRRRAAPPAIIRIAAATATTSAGRSRKRRPTTTGRRSRARSVRIRSRRSGFARVVAAMTLEQKVGQMTQLEVPSLFDDETGTYQVEQVTELAIGIGADRRRRVAELRQARGGRRLGGAGRRHLGCVAGHRGPGRGRSSGADPDPGDVGHRRGARQRQRVRRDGVPAQHRPRRHPRHLPDARDRRRDHASGARDRRRLDLRSLPGGGARRPLGPHLRVLVGGPEPGARLRRGGERRHPVRRPG